MNTSFEPFVGLGPLKFGMSKSEVDAALTMISGINECSFQNDKLCSISIDPSEIEGLLFSGKDILKMNRLSCALYFADKSKDYGQAQGGSLYFLDLGCAILQFESSIREFFLFSRQFDTGEPLREMTPDLIQNYYEENTYSD